MAVRPLGGPFSSHRAGLARKSVFCYWTPDFVNGPFVTLDNIFDLAPSDRFLVAARRAFFRLLGRILPQKSVFCYRTPNFVNGPFVTLCETVDLAPLDRFLKFSFPSYGPKWPKMAWFWPFLARKSVFCHRTPNFVNGPFVTLYETVDLAPLDRFLNFSFPSYGPKWPKMAIFWNSHLRRESTLNFGPISKKLGQMVRVTKKMTWYGNEAIPGPNYGETAVCSFGRKVKNGPKLRFLLYKHAQNGYSLLIIWEKGTFFFGQHCPVVTGRWLELRSEHCLGQNFRSIQNLYKIYAGGAFSRQ